MSLNAIVALIKNTVGSMCCRLSIVFQNTCVDPINLKEKIEQ